MSSKPLFSILAAGLTLCSTCLWAESKSETTPSAVVAVDRAPVVISRVAPTYPYALREHGVQGRVVLDVLVDARGRVASISPVASSHPELAERAIEAVRQWRFQPAEVGGQPVAAQVQLPINFVLPQLAVFQR